METKDPLWLQVQDLVVQTPEMYKPLMGKVLTSVRVVDDGHRIAFTFIDGTTKSYRVTADCCSDSWIEHLEAPIVVEGAEVYCVSESGPVEVPHASHECLKVYTVTFKTSKGDITLEFRNSSNGYYGGSLEEIVS